MDGQKDFYSSISVQGLNLIFDGLWEQQNIINISNWIQGEGILYSYGALDSTINTGIGNDDINISATAMSNWWDNPAEKSTAIAFDKSTLNTGAAMIRYI